MQRESEALRKAHQLAYVASVLGGIATYLFWVLPWEGVSRFLVWGVGAPMGFASSFGAAVIAFDLIGRPFARWWSRDPEMFPWVLGMWDHPSSPPVVSSVVFYVVGVLVGIVAAREGAMDAIGGARGLDELLDMGFVLIWIGGSFCFIIGAVSLFGRAEMFFKNERTKNGEGS